MTSALSSVMDQAAAAAAAFTPAPEASALIPAAAAGLPSTAVARPSLDDMADNSGIQVDAYLSVKETGLRIDKNPVFQKAKVRLTMSEVAPIFSVRATKGGATTFIKSYDGVTTSQGQNFQQATAQLQASHDKVDGPYQTAEIPVELLENVAGAEKGQRLGITPAITGVKFWTKFYKEVRDARLLDSTVDVEIECIPQTNRNGNEWGVVGFKLLGAAQ